MPLYSYACSSCSERFEEFAALVDYRKPQACPTCGGAAERVLGDRAPGIVLRGDGWPGKNLRVRNQMRQKNEVLARKERDLKVTMPKLVPNVEGEQVNSWSDAAKLAKDRGKEVSGYERYARKEGVEA